MFDNSLALTLHTCAKSHSRVVCRELLHVAFQAHDVSAASNMLVDCFATGYDEPTACDITS